MSRGFQWADFDWKQAGSCASGRCIVRGSWGATWKSFVVTMLWIEIVGLMSEVYCLWLPGESQRSLEKVCLMPKILCNALSPLNLHDWPMPKTLHACDRPTNISVSKLAATPSKVHFRDDFASYHPWNRKKELKFYSELGLRLLKNANIFIPTNYSFT